MKENQQILQFKKVFNHILLRFFALTEGKLVFLFLCSAFLFNWQPVLAHGGGELQINNAPVGEYQVSVWNNPPTARSGQVIHITVGIAQASTGEPVLDGAVQVSIVSANGEILTTAAATTEQSVNRLFYEADLEGVSTGTYEMQVEVMGADGRGVLTFPLPVQPVAWWPWIAGAAGAVIVIFLGLRAWRKGPKAGASRRATAVPRRRTVD